MFMWPFQLVVSYLFRYKDKKQGSSFFEYLYTVFIEAESANDVTY
jgi:hypothetical protein